MMDHERRAFPWERLIPPLILFVLLAFGLYYGVILKARRQGYERDGERGLRQISKAEEDFRFNDRDANAVNDYWTGDVAGLYRFGLIERGIAEADGRPLVPLVPKPVPYNGYFFIALDADASRVPPMEYRQDTDGTSGRVHNLEGFGFVAYPAEVAGKGQWLFMGNENRSVFRANAAAVPIPKDWPRLAERQQFWSLPQ